MATITKGVYKQFNGTDWDHIYFKTSADMVNQTTQRIFLNPEQMTINGNKLAAVNTTTDANGNTTYSVTPQKIVLYATNIPLAANETGYDGTNITNVAGALSDRIKINGATESLTVKGGIFIGPNTVPSYTITTTGFSRTDLELGTKTLTLPFDSVAFGETVGLVNTKYLHQLNYISSADAENKYLTKAVAEADYATKALLVSDYAPLTSLNNLGRQMITSEERQRIKDMWDLWKADDDTEGDNTLVDKVKEVLKAFENYPESDNLFTVLSNKIDKDGATDDLTINETLHLKSDAGIVFGNLKNNPSYINGADSFSKLDMVKGSVVFKLPYDDTNTHKPKNTYSLASTQWVDDNYATKGSLSSLATNLGNTLTNNYLLKTSGEASNLTITDALNFGTDKSNQYFTNGQAFVKATGNGIASFKIPFDTHGANGTYTLATTTNLESYQRKITVSSSMPAYAISKTGDIWIDTSGT